jgi:hypothetical protein
MASITDLKTDIRRVLHDLGRNPYPVLPRGRKALTQMLKDLRAEQRADPNSKLKHKETDDARNP